MTSEYAALGRIGVGTPQANPTVEDEFRILIPRDVGMHFVRLTSDATEPAERLQQYLVDIGSTLKRFDTLQLDAFAFACTASSYLLGRRREVEIIDALAAPYPIITATAALCERLHSLGAQRIAIAAPYSQTIVTAATEFWKAEGFEIVAAERIVTKSSDTRSIYELTSADAQPVVRRLQQLDVDAVLLTGTGMPSLAIVDERHGVPVVSSNQCLAQSVLAKLSGQAASSSVAAAR